MQRWRGPEQVPADWGRCVVTIGFFDGVHLGHQQILGRAVAAAAQRGVPSVVLTFDPHPSEVVRPGSHPALLTTARYKADLLAALGVDALCVLPFTLDFSRLSPEVFVADVLVAGLHADAVVVGSNFRFGYRAAGDLDTLTALGLHFGFATEGVALVSHDGTAYSSTYVRGCIAAGDVAAAAVALGRPHRLEGVVVRGDQRGRTLGYPTANLQPDPYAAVPGDGIYAGWLLRGSERYRSAISIGTNPTFEGLTRRIEAYVLDEDIDLYGDIVALDFIQKVRDTEKFDRIEDLVLAIDGDVRNVRSLLH